MEFNPTTIPLSFYKQLSGYTLIIHQNYYDLGEQFMVINELDDTNKVLEEDVYILEKLPWVYNEQVVEQVALTGHYVKLPFMYSTVAAREIWSGFEACISLTNFT